MSLPRAWIWAGAAAIVLGAGLVGWLRQAAPTAPLASASTSATAPRAATAAPAAGTGMQEAAAALTPLAQPLAAASQAQEAPPPWATSLAATAAAQDPAKQQALLAELRARSQQQAQMTEKLLAELDRREAAHQLPAGINVQAMRANLRISQQLQQISAQIQTLAAQPDSPQRRQALQAKVAELQQLQRQVRLDVMGPAVAGAAAPKAVTQPSAGKQ